jgi:hypothetical protein
MLFKRKEIEKKKLFGRKKIKMSTLERERKRDTV